MHSIGSLVQIIISAIALFFGILVWRRTRNITWILLVLLSFLMYLSPTIAYLQHLGILGIFPTVVEILIRTLPSVVMILVFILYIKDHPYLK